MLFVNSTMLQDKGIGKIQKIKTFFKGSLQKLGKSITPLST